MSVLSAPAARIEPLGDSALRIVLGDTLDPVVNRRVCALADRIAVALAAGRLPGVTDVLPAFSVVGVHYRADAIPTDGNESPFAALLRLLSPLLPEREGLSIGVTDRLIEIPVCYGGEFGPDLEETSAACGMTPDELIALHQNPSEEQRVYMIGFAPGNPYVGRLDPALAIPRRATPRTHMPMGTVCIANRQTVVYPVAAPGGWHMIGRTPLRLFDPARAEPCMLRPGDRIRFKAIDPDSFARAMEAA
ncbi:5-oxoprolinase subunit PxpB [Variovorax atrisoli]|uniref:5-oxoprolinase subunit PxpB n=1 Tax=Variovorax atrisoli TaxID=3394203 RepID=UPI000F7E883C|nr:5-oxoprolinase subunit PxpB [Variovorax sp. 369]RTD94712.1 5-oxoprolinase subunit PxpB [Variovorax sp. 369]